MLDVVGGDGGLMTWHPERRAATDVSLCARLQTPGTVTRVGRLSLLSGRQKERRDVLVGLVIPKHSPVERKSVQNGFDALKIKDESHAEPLIVRSNTHK